MSIKKHEFHISVRYFRMNSTQGEMIPCALQDVKLGLEYRLVLYRNVCITYHQ